MRNHEEVESEPNHQKDGGSETKKGRSVRIKKIKLAAIRKSKRADYPYRRVETGGFGYQVNPSGNKSFISVLHLSEGRKQRRIGDVGELSINRARQIHMEWKVDSEKDSEGNLEDECCLRGPILEDFDLPVIEGDIGRLFDEYFRDCESRGRKNFNTLRGRYQKHILPNIDPTSSPDSLKLPEAQQLVDYAMRTAAASPKASRGGKSTAREMKNLISATYDFGIRNAGVKSADEKYYIKFSISKNPAHGVMLPDGTTNSVDTVLTPIQIWELFQIYKGHLPLHGLKEWSLAAMLGMLSIGARPSEVLRFSRNDVEEDNGRPNLVLRNTKTSKDQFLPLSDTFFEFIYMKQVRKNPFSKFPFSAHNNRASLAGTVAKHIGYYWNNTNRKTLYTARDLRTTTSSHMQELMIPKEQIKQILNHALGNDITEKHYLKSKNLDAKTFAIKRWSYFLFGLYGCENQDEIPRDPLETAYRGGDPEALNDAVNRDRMDSTKKKWVIDALEGDKESID